MARTADQIAAFIKSRIADTASIALLAENENPESVINEFIDCVAAVMATHEVIADEHIAAVETQINTINPHTEGWLRQKAFEFQYDDSNPQILTTIAGEVQYETVDTALRIVSHCAIDTATGRRAILYIAKGSPPEPLSTAENNALTNYFNSLVDPAFTLIGSQTDIVSLEPDYCYLKAEVKYNGLYSATIVDNVTEAIESYLYSPLNTDGTINPFQLTEAVQAVPGVKDFIIEDMAVRANSDLFSAKVHFTTTFLYHNTVIATTAGYYHPEVTTGETLTDKLTFTAV